MLRIVDMKDALDSDGSFAVYDTITGMFLAGEDGEQAWETFEEFTEVYHDENRVDRVKALLPDNTKM